jgi:probable HAF family extracellular repeat protein
MVSIFKVGAALSASTIMLITTSHSVSAASLYSVTDIGVIDRSFRTGEESSQAFGINNKNQVVGVSTIGFTPLGGGGFVWDSQNKFQNIGISSIGPFGNTRAYDINDKGIVVGDTVTSRQSLRGFAWDSQKAAEISGIDLTLPTDPAIAFSTARAINNNNQVVGSSTILQGERAYISDSVNGIRNLGTLGTNNSAAYAINDKGEVVGTSGNAFLWDSTNGLQDLKFAGAGYGINEKSQVVGSANFGDQQGQAFLWDRANGVVSLGTLPGDNTSQASSINENSQIVGTSTSSQGDKAVIWQNGIISDLNSLIPTNSGWVLNQASDINDAGFIVGTGIINNVQHAFLLQPISPSTSIPEPGTILGLFVFATGATFTLKRKRTS